MRRLHTAPTLIALIILILGSAPPTFAQPLTDHVPADAFVYFGWAGTRTPGTGYEGSHLSALVNDANVQATFAKIESLIADKLKEEKQEDVQNWRDAIALLAPYFKYPSAVFVEPSGDKKAPVRAGVLCRAGADADALVTNLELAIRKGGDDTKDLMKVVKSGDVVELLINYGDAPSAVSGGKTLAGASGFTDSMHEVDHDAFVSFYLSLEGGLKLTDSVMVSEKATEEDRATFWRVMEAGGLKDLHHVAVTGKFLEKDWTAAAYLQAPAPRKGLIALLEGRPVTAEDLKWVPDSAVVAQVSRFDVAALLREVRNMCAAATPQAAVWYDRIMGGAQMAIGRNLLNDIFEPLGDTWIVYSDASLGTAGGMVVINPLDDPAKFQQGMNALWIAANNFLRAPAIQQRVGQNVQLRQVKDGALTVSIVQTPMWSIAWTVGNGKFVIGPNVEIVTKAANAAPAAKGFDQNEKYAALAKKLSGGAQVTALAFADLPATAPGAYAKMEAILAQVREAAKKEGVELPEKILPAWETIKAHVSPSAEVGWSTDKGLHARSISPFPGSDSFANAQTGSSPASGTAAAAMGVLAPSLNRAREMANRVKCASNQRQIMRAILLYSNDRRGQYPPDLGTLVLTEPIEPEVFLCPNDETELPKNYSEMNVQQRADWITRNSSYVYLGKGKNNAIAADAIVLHEKETDHGGDGVNIAYADGHVEFQPMPQAKQLIQQQAK